MYEKRFLCGVAGGFVVARDDDEYRPAAECPDGGRVGSGETVWGAICGMVFSNNSARKRVEKVRLASSAMGGIIIISPTVVGQVKRESGTYSSESEDPPEAFAS